MLFWLICAGMAAAVALAITRPLVLRRRAPAASAVAADVAVYRSHLAEIDADRLRGLLSDEEAVAARTEASRRLLGRTEAAAPSASEAAAPSAAAALWGAVLLVPSLSLGLYLALGSPLVPDQPHAARLVGPPANASLAELVERVEARLRARPDDGHGWDVIAPVYVRLGRYGDAVQAYGNAIRLSGETARRQAGLGEAIALARGGIVPAEAREALERALALEAGLPQARYWLAVAREQDGERDAALGEYRALLAQSPPDSGWRAAVEQRIAALSAPGGEGTATAGAGPGVAEAAAAADLTPMQRQEMITAMVEGLARRLAADGRDLAGWQRLLRAYVVLGRRQDASRALADARRALAGDAGSLAVLDSFALALGLGS